MIGPTVSHYRVIEELGAGSMGEVYRAEDTRLGREVALKVLPPRLQDDEAVIERFRREARLASALNHPNICTIHDIGEHEGRQFIVMECLEGATLRQLIGNGPLPVGQAIELATEVCDALQAAHARGVVHRDIKPANIFVTARGSAKVMDFGLAKMMSPEPERSPLRGRNPEDSTATDGVNPVLLTHPGSPLGTVAYMSPEQAHGRDVDARADLFSLGAVLYEMLTGERAFPGGSAAAVFDAILNRSPIPVGERRPEVPAVLVRVVDRALEKDREQRYQNAGLMLDDLRQAREALRKEAARPREGAGAFHAARRWRPEIVAAALVAIGSAVIAAAVWLTDRPEPVLTSRDSVLLGEVQNDTGEPVFDGTLRQALAWQLGQSPFLDIVADERVNATLRLMGRQPNEPLTHDVARDACQRQGNTALIEGAIARLGTQYSLMLTVSACESGEVVAREQATAESREAVLEALKEAASALRARLGESLSSVRSFTVPMEQATTPSLDAIKAYTLGVARRRQGNELEALPFFQRAIELDPHFASAYFALSTVYGNLGESDKAAEFGQRAFTERQHVSERERLSIEFQYYDRVTGEFDKAIASLLMWEQTFPRDYSPSNSLALLYNRVGQFERAAEKAEEARRRNPDHPFPHSNLAYAYRGLGRFADARAAGMRAVERGFETLPTRRLLYQLAVMEGDTDGALAHQKAASGRAREFDMHGAEAQIAAFQGRLGEARQLYERTEAMARRASLGQVAAGYELQLAWAELLFGRTSDAAARAGPLVASGSADVTPLAVAILALAGQPDGLDASLDRVAHMRPDDMLLRTVFLPVARASQQLARGRAQEAIKTLDVSEPYDLGRVAAFVPAYLRAEAYARLGNGPAAVAQYQRILDHRGTDPFSVFYAAARVGLARAHVLAGNREAARQSYDEFLAAWSRADAQLPLLLAARAERMAVADTSHATR